MSEIETRPVPTPPRANPRPRHDHDRDAPLEVAGRHLYLVGIGGCGMSGLARMLAARGARVAGSDAARSETTDRLAAEGVPVSFDQAAGALPDACDLIVASAAIKPDHPEILAAERRGIPVLTYAEALGRSMIGRTGVAIAGTHGKSTTTAMLGSLLADAGLDPTVVVGATCAQLEGGSLAEPARPAGFRLGAERLPAGHWAGRPGVVLAEACEYNRSFHNFRPTLASIGSVEADHLDIYGSLDEIVAAFRGFAELVAPAEDGGLLLIAHDGAHRREVASGLPCRVETIGFNPAADWVVSFEPTTRLVSLRRGRGLAWSWTLRMPGQHNAMNSAIAFALAHHLGAPEPVAARSLAAFQGLDRRCQFLGERPLPAGGAVRVYDDYGHHPTEIEATLRALRELERPEDRGGRLVCVFQPHQHSRTRFLLEEFASAFGQADVVVVPHIYFVRDSQEERTKVTAGDLVDRLRQRGVRAMHLYPFEAIVEQLENTCRPGDLLVVMGAGPVWQVARDYLKRTTP